MRKTMTANEVVAYNLKRIRELRGLQQVEAGKLVEPFLGRWSQSMWSEAERSVSGKRTKLFDAGELVAFSHVFKVPLTFFLEPPYAVEEVACAKSYERTVPASELKGATT